MTLPLVPPLEPMLAKPVSRLPDPDDLPGGVAYEPKWDGFRALVFRDGDDVGIWGRGGKDLAYAFPEVVDAARAGLPTQVVLDGELVIAREGRLWFEQLQMRLRPRSEAGGWKIAELARDLPATFVGFDLLALGDESLLDAPYGARREHPGQREARHAKASNFQEIPTIDAIAERGSPISLSVDLQHCSGRYAVAKKSEGLSRAGRLEIGRSNWGSKTYRASTPARPRPAHRRNGR